MDTNKKNKGFGWIRFFFVNLILVFFLIQTGTLKAQDEIKKEKLPKSVVNAIETDFISCSDKISWQVFDESIRNPDQYVATASGRNVSCEAVYDKNGKLIRSKTIMSNVKLPAEVHAAIKQEYPGWRITGDQAVIRNFNENTKYYQIYIENEAESKSVFYNATGKSIKPPSGTLEGNTTEISKEDVPEAVVSAIETDYLSCKENITWRLDDEKATPDHYVATAKGKNVTCEAIYNKDGKLIRSKSITTNIKLPAEVHTAIKQEYPGWKITGDQAVVRNFDENTKYFEIYLEKEGESKTVYYSAMGKQVKPRYS